MSKEFSVEDLKALMQSVCENEVSELLFENETVKLRIRNQKETIEVGGPTAVFQTKLCQPAGNDGGQAAQVMDITTVPAGEGKCVTSPLVGTYYASSAPDKEAFVHVGQRVHKGDILFIVESMKVMNEVIAEQEDVVAEVMVDNGQPVEYGQPVLRME